MGLEAVCRCRVDDVSADAKALLEARELILRAPFRRTIKIADMSEVGVAGDQLRICVATSTISLELGPATAGKWAERIAAPPVSLAKKLGIGHESPVFAIGAIDEPVLAEVVDGRTADATTAKISLAIVHDLEELGRVLKRHEAAMGNAPIWIVHGKGPLTAFGEAPVRQHMRARSYRDTKVSAVSKAWTATRYSPG